MRTLKLQIQLSIDGYIAGPNGEMDWMTWNWDDALKRYTDRILEPVDCIVLGRRLAEGFIPHWAAVADNPNDPEYEAGQKFTNTPKVVFTKTLGESKWPNTVLAKADLVEDVTQLKQQQGSDIYACGGASFVSALIKNRLIDEFHLFINPVALGQGMPIFQELESKQDLKLVESTRFDCGIVVLNYGLKHD
ncbi:dihydrofolate reductase family protein [Nodosilinea sp. PGN35]|uniref:dihydrofolate reductase family protein n=1 Tax=Nodosilinea sp. PGN35 TaxID=3020489 RepID=UPI0023B34C9B|nr:dihydrofolate reductase family protein [Nodosilinea sp. TSF1-S3]MDF0365233.1 dihydrofolate reductase family protein [Nodosilinea sp. TSF1-S3]